MRRLSIVNPKYILSGLKRCWLSTPVISLVPLHSQFCFSVQGMPTFPTCHLLVEPSSGEDSKWFTYHRCMLLTSAHRLYPISKVVMPATLACGQWTRSSFSSLCDPSSSWTVGMYRKVISSFRVKGTLGCPLVYRNCPDYFTILLHYVSAAQLSAVLSKVRRIFLETSW